MNDLLAPDRPREPAPPIVAGAFEDARPEPLDSHRARLRPFEFSTRSVPQREQFDAWRSSYSSILDLRSKTDAGEGFDGRHAIWDLGSIVFSRVATDGLDFSGLAGHGRREPLDHWQFSMLVSGRSVTEAEGARRLVGRAGTVQIHPLGRPFAGQIDRSELLMLFVPRDLCRDTAHVLDAASFSRLDGALGRIFADYLVSVAQRLPLLDAAEVGQLVTATRAMLLACVQPSRDRLDEAESSISYLLLERARCYIQSHLRDPGLSSQSLVQELGTSRSRLYRLFEASGGVMRYVQQRRLAAAHAALANPSDTRRILEIAESFCFADGAEFSRAFRREFGYSPSDARAGSRGGGGGPRLGESEQGDAPTGRLNHLLRRLQG